MQGIQLEFDLVIPAAPDQLVNHLLHEARDAEELAEEKRRDATLAARLNYEDLGCHSLKQTESLIQLRVLLSAAGCSGRARKLWELHAQKDPRRLRKLVLALKRHYNL
jgi:hypothetical protein